MSKFCPNCGKEIEENTVFCGSCGARINGASPVNNNGKTNGMAIAGFVCSLVSVFFGALIIPGILGLVFSITGLKQISANGDKGKGLAVAGLVISIVMLALYVILFLSVCSIAGCLSIASYY